MIRSRKARTGDWPIHDAPNRAARLSHHFLEPQQVRSRSITGSYIAYRIYNRMPRTSEDQRICIRIVERPFIGDHLANRPGGDLAVRYIFFVLQYDCEKKYNWSWGFRIWICFRQHVDLCNFLRGIRRTASFVRAQFRGWLASEVASIVTVR
jgi:hypothetical protein